MVCLGNICRSPLAHGILESKLSSSNFEVDSAGTSNYHIGDLPDKRSIEVAKKNGLDITHQRGRQFLIEDFDRFNFIYVMDKSNFHDIINQARNDNDTAKVKLILNESYPDQNLEVPDPYYGGNSGFDTVYNMLDKACNAIAKQLKK